MTPSEGMSDPCIPHAPADGTPARLGLWQSLRGHGALLSNAGALVAGTLCTAIMGFAYWWVAARLITPADVGLVAAATSVILLLAQAGEVGLGPLLVGEVPRDPRRAPALISTALAGSAVGCALVAAAFVALARIVPIGFGGVLGDPGGGCVFLVGVTAAGVTLVADQALIGLMRSKAAMWRAITFSLMKLILLAMAGSMGAGAETILATWVASLIGSLLLTYLFAFARPGRGALRLSRPRSALLRPLAGRILSHHGLNLAMQAPALALPFMVTVTVSAEANAAFYTLWTFVTVSLAVPAALSAVTYSIGSGDPTKTASGIRLSAALALASSIGTGLILLWFSPLLLGLFNPRYQTIAGSDLQMMGFGALPIAIKYLYVSVQRLRGRLTSAACWLAVGAVLELGAAVVGGSIGGLSGLTEAWLAAACVQILVMAPAIATAAFPDLAPGRVSWAASVGLAAAGACMMILGGSIQPIAAPHAGFVHREGRALKLDGQTFRIAGVNNHYLPFCSRDEAIRVLDDAAALGANVVRTFIQPVIGSVDGRVPTIWNWTSNADASDLGTRGAHILSFDPTARRMRINDGPDGLARMDFVIAEARRRNIKLIIAVLDFWAYTGGAQQMAAWYGGTDKYSFFASDPRTREDYRAWAKHLLNRRNALTGLLYKDDPTILAWDLANEPDIHPRHLLVDWLTEMSAYVKSIDPNHLVASGHANPTPPFADFGIPSIDLVTWHGYPGYARLTIQEFDALIRHNCKLAEAAGKPMLLEEFGLARSDPDQASAYRAWLDTIAASPACSGWVVWRLVSTQDSGRFPSDPVDQFDLRNDGGETWNTVRAAARGLTSDYRGD